MYTLTFPIQLPEEHSFFDNGQYPVPPLPGGLAIHSMELGAGAVSLRISGFASAEEALAFCPTLTRLLRISALDSRHSITPSGKMPVQSDGKHFEGSVPTVTLTEKNAMPYYGTVRQTSQLHISVLAKQLSAGMSDGSATKINGSPELALALELFSDFEFAGGSNAQFIMLFTALEVLVPKASTKGKRGAVLGVVKASLSNAGHPNPKSVGKELDALYVARNDLVHAGKTASLAQLASLREIVRMTLKALVASQA